MKYFNLILLLSFCTVELFGQAVSNDRLKDLCKENGIIGVSAAYSIEGKLGWNESYGFSEKDNEVPFTNNTLTRIASIAKPMTAVAIMQLREKGLLKLDDPIAKYLPEFSNHLKGEISIRQLLSHTSGIGAYKSGKEAQTKREFINLKEAVEVFKDRELLFEPASDYSYSTYGYVILGRIIEEISTLSYEKYLQKNIWDKIDMDHTGVEKYHQHYDNKSALYHRHKRKTKLEDQNNLSGRIPGGGIYSNMNDVIKFGEALLDHSLISKESFDIMREVQFDRTDGNSYGLGWFLYGNKPNNGSIIGHSGEQTGCSSQIFIIPERKTVVVVLSNTSGTWKSVVKFASELINTALSE